MKAVAVTAPGRVEVVDVPMPKIREYECLVKVRACGLCNGTDLKIIDNEVSAFPVEYPVILGHEGVGEIVELGSKVRNLKVGEIYLNPYGWIGPNTPYKSMWAGMVEYAIVQDQGVMDELGIDQAQYRGWGCLPLPAGIDPVDGGVVLTLKECLSAVRNFGFQEGQEALVYGDGPVGLALINFLRISGAAWVGCVGHHDQRLERIRQLAQADLVINSHEESVAEKLGQRKLDLVIDAVGSVQIIRESSRCLKPGGKVGIFGVIKKKEAMLSLLDLANHTTLHMLNWPYREHAVHDEIVGLILEGKINPKHYYSHRMPLEDAPQAVAMVKNREAFKVLLIP